MRLQDLKLQSTSTVRRYGWDTNKIVWELIMYNIFSIFFCVYRLPQNIKGFGAKKYFTDHQTRSGEMGTLDKNKPLQNGSKRF